MTGDSVGFINVYLFCFEAVIEACGQGMFFSEENDACEECGLGFFQVTNLNRI